MDSVDLLKHKMSLHQKVFEDCDSRASDHNTDLSLNRPAYGPEETHKWNILHKLKTDVSQLNFKFDRKHQKLVDKIQELSTITNELESMHKKTKVGSLTGATLGAAGGIMSIVGLCLAPVTLGASLIVTGVGAAVGITGGVTGATSNIIKFIQNKNLRQDIKKITSDFQDTIDSMIEDINTINNSTEDIQLLVQHKSYTPENMKAEVKGAVSGLPNVKESKKSPDEFGKVVAVPLCSSVVKKGFALVKPAKNVFKGVRFSGQTAKILRAGAAVGAAISALFVALDLVFIVKESMDIAEINQLADKRKVTKKIKSNTLKFIQQMRETVVCFQKTLDQLKDAHDVANKEFNQEMNNSVSLLSSARQKALSDAKKEFNEELKNSESLISSASEKPNGDANKEFNEKLKNNDSLIHVTSQKPNGESNKVFNEEPKNSESLVSSASQKPSGDTNIFLFDQCRFIFGFVLFSLILYFLGVMLCII